MAISVYLIWVYTLVSTSLAASKFPKLLLISFDGFRYDLLNQTMAPNIYAWTKESSWFVNGSQSQYISYTAPNHMSIVTGMYEESHGIVSNYFFDYKTNKTFDYFNSTRKDGVVNASLAQEWYKGQPIWITNEIADSGRISSTYYWPNGEASFPTPPHKPSEYRAWKTYRNLTAWEQDVEDIVQAFKRVENPVNFLAWYVEEPDHTLHTNGFYNGALTKKIKELDSLFGYLIKRLESFGLRNEINIILTADHGHAEIIDEKHVMCIPDYVSDKSLIRGDHMIYPRDEEHALAIYKNLTDAVKKNAFDVAIHMKENFPEKYHYHNSSRIGKIIIEPKVGSAVSFSCTHEKLQKDYGNGSQVKFNSSTHGMDPERPEMRAFLIMGGPSFEQNKKIENIPQNVDLYPLMCILLDIPASPNNGSISVVKQALKSAQKSSINFNAVTDNVGFMIFIIPAIIIVLLYFALGCRHTVMKDDPNWGAAQTNGYRPLQTNCVDMEAADLEVADESRRLRSEGAVKMSGLLQNDGWSDDDLDFS